MISYKVIGHHIKAARQRLNMTQVDCSERAGISPAYFGKIERGAIRPNIDRLGDICQVLNLPFESIFQGAFIPDGALLDNLPPPAEEFEVTLMEIRAKADDRTKYIIMRICAELSNLLDPAEKP